ncbi:MAG: 50S ribosomal protein L1 [Candidatus Bathyarchaeota archaeon]|nr:50S ribosomal protein L1 [Candidatus Bathyarchaeota archaeon]
MPLSRKNVLSALEEMENSKIKRNLKQSVELIMKLQNIDLKKPENRINEAIDLPHKLDKPIKVCVIAGGDIALKAKNAKADRILSRQDIEKIASDKKEAQKLANEYDYFIAEAPLMPIIGKTLGQALGPRGKMPSPVLPNASIDDVIERHRRMVRIRVKENPNIQCRVGTEDMPKEALAENIEAVFSRIEGKLEKGSKNVAAIRVKFSMGPPVKVAL